MTSKESTFREPFNDRLQKLVTTAWHEVEADAHKVPRPVDRPLAHFSLSPTCKLVIDWVFAEATRNGEIATKSLSKSYGYIIHQPSVISKTPTIFIPLHITPDVSVCIGDEEVWEGSYYTVLKQDIINVSGEGKVFGLAMFE